MPNSIGVRLRASNVRRSDLCHFVVVLSTVLPGCQPGGAGSTGSKGEGAAQQLLPAVRVTTVKPERKTITRQTREPGQIEAFQRTPLYAKVAGFVRRFHVDIGDHVQGPYYDKSGQPTRRGQLLAEISIPELDQELLEKEAAVDQVEAEIGQARAALKVARTRVRSAEAELEQARAAVDRRDADLEKWSSEYRRIVELAKSASINPKVVDETKSQLRAAEAAVRDAASMVQAADAAIDESHALVEKAVADEAAAKARKKSAEANQARVTALVDYQRVEAPFDGTVSERNTDEGHFVQPAEAAQARPLFTIVRTDSVRIFVDVPDTDATMVDRDDRVIVQVDALGKRRFPGTVARTSWALDPSTRTLRTEIDVLNENGELRPGMYAFATIILAEHPDVLAIPLSAVRTENDKSSCFCLVAGKLVQTPISLGLSDGKDVEVVSGLTGEEEVVEKNAPTLADGKAAVVAKSDKPK
jgi:RND family efflux transporter MFP subunit